ncbi:MAG: hypothetical protein IPK50_10300 [Fibrobacterota bacterium]|nr:hypothetical protein [Fibrobacterota bacterium]QQS07267.1 MAG: hypothetical protein IPK50_10300 [Fibrobacterota bacterium]
MEVQNDRVQDLPDRSPRPTPRDSDDPDLADVTSARVRMDLLAGSGMIAGSVGSFVLILLWPVGIYPLLLLILPIVLAYSGIRRLLRGLAGLAPTRSRED